MLQIISAKEARKIVEESISNQLEKKMRLIEDSINQSIEAMKFDCEVEGHIPNELKTVLENENLEYKVEYLNEGDRAFTKISW